VKKTKTKRSFKEKMTVFQKANFLGAVDKGEYIKYVSNINLSGKQVFFLSRSDSQSSK